MALHLVYDQIVTRNEIPEQCVKDCSHSGECYNDCDYWVDKLSFTVNREDAIRWLADGGAWEKPQLEAFSDKELAIAVLWCVCCDLNEGDNEVFHMG